MACSECSHYKDSDDGITFLTQSQLEKVDFILNAKNDVFALDI